MEGRKDVFLPCAHCRRGSEEAEGEGENPNVRQSTDIYREGQEYEGAPAPYSSSPMAGAGNTGPAYEDDMMCKQSLLECDERHYLPSAARLPSGRTGGGGARVGEWGDGGFGGFGRMGEGDMEESSAVPQVLRTPPAGGGSPRGDNDEEDRSENPQLAATGSSAPDEDQSTLLRTLETLDDDERMLQSRIQHAQQMNLQMREEEFKELQYIYAQQVRRSFRNLKRMPEPSIQSRYLQTEEDELDDEEQPETPMDEIDIPEGYCICGRVSDHDGLVESIVGHSPNCYARQKQLLLRHGLQDELPSPSTSPRSMPLPSSELGGGGEPKPLTPVRPSLKKRNKKKKPKSFVTKMREIATTPPASPSPQA